MQTGLLSSLTLLLRQKVGGVNLTFGYLRQFCQLLPNHYSSIDLNFVVPRVLELTYTAYEVKPFAEDLGYSGFTIPMGR